jgi:hypothetical protein
MIPDVPYRFTIRPLSEDDESGGYLIEFPDLPGCMSDGETIEQAIVHGTAGSRRCAPRDIRSQHRSAPQRREFVADGRLAGGLASRPKIEKEDAMDERNEAQAGLKQIQEAIVALLRREPDGLRNAEIAEALNLRSDFRGRQKDYLTYSVLGGLIDQGRVAWNQETKRFTAGDS